MFTIKNKLNLLLISSSFFVAAAHAEIIGLSVEDAWIAEAPPVSKVMAGYMQLSNSGTQAIVIKKAQSDTYSSIELHETLNANGMASMVRHETIEIPADGHIELKPGGKHLMLFNPVKRLLDGDTVDIKFVSDNGQQQVFSIKVKKP
ncbi:MAG: copper chaperone PCu(A)C [Proteobacteria bacterium]|nr:copper chaperone PCu(A)C [Pseudomonadota bacterium]